MQQQNVGADQHTFHQNEDIYSAQPASTIVDASGITNERGLELQV
jgi:hypothetical protein